MENESVKEYFLNLLVEQENVQIDRDKGIICNKSGIPVISIDKWLENLNIRANYALGRNGRGE